MKTKTKGGKTNRQKAKFGLPDPEHAKSAVLVSLRSPESQRGSRRSIDYFVRWYCSEPRLSLNKTVVTRFRIYLEDQTTGSGHHKRAASGGAPTDLRSSGYRTPEPRTRSRYSPCEGIEKTEISDFEKT